jgi:uncharacterized protein
VGKFIVFLLIALVVYVLLRARSPRRHARSEATAAAEAMVSCAHCGLNVPLSESLAAAEHHYCSEEHRRLGTGSSSNG